MGRSKPEPGSLYQKRLSKRTHSTFSLCNSELLVLKCSFTEHSSREWNANCGPTMVQRGIKRNVFPLEEIQMWATLCEKEASKQNPDNCGILSPQSGKCYRAARLPEGWALLALSRLRSPGPKLHLAQPSLSTGLLNSTFEPYCKCIYRSAYPPNSNHPHLTSKTFGSYTH